MNDNILNQFLVEQLTHTIKNDPFIQQFKYSNEFQCFWEENLLYYCENDFNQITANHFIMDQMFEYPYNLYGTMFTFQFNIKYLLNSISDERFVSPILLNNYNGNLYYNKIKCKYSPCDDVIRPSSEYKDLKNILIVPFPEEPMNYIVVDGNHRVCSQIKENKQTIQALFIDEFLASISLFSSFQTCLYCLLLDITCIRTCLKQFDDLLIKNSLTAFSEKSSILHLQERDKRNNM